MKSTPYEKYFLTFILKIPIINNNLEKIANAIYSQATKDKPMTEKERDLVFSDYYICMLIRDPDETSLENIKRRLFEMFWETRSSKEYLEYETMVEALTQEIADEYEI
ncbi:hypothetical protein N9O33_04635 [Gammaproteobacteria bacterium]|nr:hypothetical protein [Gammaproteobacteria bacterium]